MEPATPVVPPPQNTNDKSDRMYGSRSIYDAKSWEIIWKNFLAGLMRGLGSVLIWLIFTTIIFNITMAIFWPRLQPYFKKYFDALDTLGTVQSTPSTGINFNDLNQLLEQFQAPQ